jgi:hypothetical protein
MQSEALTDEQFEIWLAAQASPKPEVSAAAAAASDDEEEAPSTNAPNARSENDMDEMAHHAQLKVPLKPRLAQVELLPSQTEHVARLNEILDSFPFALDMSMLGAGKTYTSAHIAMQRAYKHVIVVCPMSVMPKWKMMHATYNIPIRQILGYQSLRSVKFKQPKHGLLHRRDFASGPTLVEFTPTSAFRKLVEEGLLLIFDEVQNIKNISSQFLAAKALIHAITLRNGPLLQSCRFPQIAESETGTRDRFASHALMLSASPIDKVEQAIHVFRATGVMTEDRIAQQNIQTGVLDWRGMAQIQQFCEALHKTPVIRYRYDGLQDIAYRMFQTSFKTYVSSAMPPPNSARELLKRNAFYNIDKEGAEIVRRGLSNLQTAAQWDGSQIHFVPDATAAQMASVTRSLQIIETGKIQLFARVAQEALSSHPRRKVVIAVNFSATVVDLQTLLKDHHPLILTGASTEKQRGDILRQFQTASTEHRLLICNQSVASTGIDLDDKDGRFPRLALVSPNYSTIMSYQLGHRFLRLDTKSDANVHFVFAKYEQRTKQESRDIIEIGVLDALSRKSSVMRETAGLAPATSVVFPGEHPDWFEGGAGTQTPHPPQTAI